MSADRGYCEAPGCTSKAVGRHADGWRACKRHKYGPCTAPGCTSAAMAIDPTTGLPVCKGHRYGPCTAPGCTSVANSIDAATGLPVCSSHKYGPCTAPGCTSVANSIDPTTGLPVCSRHKYGPCTAPGCTSAAMAIDPTTGRPVCKGHRYGPCTAPGCTSQGNNIDPTTGLPVCSRHKYGPCAMCPVPAKAIYDGVPLCSQHRHTECIVDGCERKGRPRWQGYCRTHATHGPDYVADGMQPSKPGAIYVVWHPQYGAMKVGIGVAKGRRVAGHTRAGWRVVHHDETGLTLGQARALEAKVLAEWRRAGVPVGVLADTIPGWYGHTETAPGSLQDARAVAAWVAAGDPAAPVPLPAGWLAA